MKMHLSNLSPQVAADIQQLYKMHLGEDVRQQAALEILSNKKQLRVALIHARSQILRDNRSCAFESLDKQIGYGGVSMYDLLVASDPATFMDELIAARSRCDVLDEQSEKVLDILREGGAALGRAAGKTPRRGQQLVALLTARAAAAKKFNSGGSGQGGLDFGNGVCA